MTTYAAYTDTAIYGLGTTEAAALADAHRNIDPSAHDADMNPLAPTFSVAPCSEALAEKVERFGGDLSFDLVRGVLRLPEED
jgi:hypothetical protein